MQLRCEIKKAGKNAGKQNRCWLKTRTIIDCKFCSLLKSQWPVLWPRFPVRGWVVWRWEPVSGLESIKKKSACQLSEQKGASRRLSRTKIAFTCVPWGKAWNTGLSQTASNTRARTRTHSLIWAETYTFFLSFMPDYNGIVLTQPMHSQTHTFMWKRQMVQKSTIISAYI